MIFIKIYSLHYMVEETKKKIIETIRAEVKRCLKTDREISHVFIHPESQSEGVIIEATVQETKIYISNLEDLGKAFYAVFDSILDQKTSIVVHMLSSPLHYSKIHKG